MDKKKLLNWIAAQPEAQRLAARQLLDALVRAARSGTGSCTLFMDPEALKNAESVTAHFPDVQTEALPEGAERRVICIQTPRDAAEITVLAIDGDDELRHRDILGAVLATGVVRDRVGDIRTDGNRAEIMVKDSVAGFLAESLRQIGRQSVRVTDTFRREFLIAQDEGELSRIVVASVRLDAVTAAVTHLARQKAQQKIRKGDVKKNHTVCTDAAQALAAGDLLSIRGYGRYRIVVQEGTTRKGNLFFTVSHSKS